MIVGIGSDHRGFRLKNHLCTFLRARGQTLQDFGAFSEEPVDYPDIAAPLVESLLTDGIQRGILICGTGLGMAIAANKAPGIFAAPVTDIATARLARQSNNVQILTLGAQVVTTESACVLVETWLTAEFRGGDSARKIAKIRAMEARYYFRATSIPATSIPATSIPVDALQVVP